MRLFTENFLTERNKKKYKMNIGIVGGRNFNDYDM